MRQYRCNVSFKGQFREKNPVLPVAIEKCLFLILARNIKILQHLINHFCSFIHQVIAYRRLITKENFILLALKVVTDAYERGSLTRDCKYSDLT